MEKRGFGRTEMNVSVLGFGGAEIGYHAVDVDTVARLLNGALDAGLNVIDTAECYAGSEELIGKTVSHRRDDYYLFTKVGHRGSFDVPAWDRNSIIFSIEQSLRRLKTDRLDLVQLHSCAEDILRKGEAIEALQQAKTEGKTRFAGYSGDGNAAKFAIKCGAFDALQTSLNIADQESIDELLPLTRQKQMGVIIKRPVANVAWREKTLPTNTYYHTYWERLQQLQYSFLNFESDNGHLNDEVATALRFTLMNDGVHTAIAGTTRPERWQQNAMEVAKGPLPQEQYEAIRQRWKQIAQRDWVGQG